MKTILLILACACTISIKAQTNNSKFFPDNSAYIATTVSNNAVYRKKTVNAEILSSSIKSGKLHLKINKPISLFFYDSDGRLLYNKRLQEGKQVVDVGNYQKGEYFVHTEDATTRIIVD